MLSIQTIVVPTDFSDCAALAFDHALMHARHFEATLHLLHVTDEDDASTDAQAQIDRFLTAYDLGDVPLERHIVRGEAPDDAVLDYTDEVGADLLVLGTHGRRGLKRLVLGSVAEDILRKAPCPALAACKREDEDAAPAPPEDILLPLDLSEHSRTALPAARALASTYGARLHLIYVVEDVPLPPAYGVPPTASPSPPTNVEAHAEQALEQISPQMEDLDVETETHLGAGLVVPELLRVVEEEGIDLIVMASHGRSGLARVLMGSVTEEVLRKASCPVFVVRAFPPSAADEA
jgi:nucleotide-binding universal stress UspA family protein